MSVQIYSLMIGNDHSVPIVLYGGTAVITVDQTGGTVFYADNSQVSAAQNQGSIAPGGNQTFTSNNVVWLRSAGLAGVKIQVTSATGTTGAPSGTTIPQPLTIMSRGARLVDTSFHGGVSIFLSDSLWNPQDSKFYVVYAAGANWGLLQSTSPTGPWTDLGVISGIPSVAAAIQQARMLLSPVTNKWSFYFIQGGQPQLYQTAAAAAITSSFTLTANNILTVGIGNFDETRISEVFVFVDQGGTWRMLYMGMNGASTAEQIGMATATSPEGPWTKYAGYPTPLIANGTAGSFDNTIDADPCVVYYNGIYYILQSYGGPNDVTGAGVFGMAITTTTDWVNFTKRGIAFPPDVAAPGKGDCFSAWGGNVVWQGKDNTCALPTTSAFPAIYYNYFGKALSGNTVNPMQAQIDPYSFYGGQILQNSPWTRVEAESADGRLTTTGAGWSNVTAGATFNRGWSGTGFKTTAATGDAQQLSWTGRRARLVMMENINYGIANIILDGSLVGTYDANYGNGGETLGAPVFAFDTGELSPGAHTLKVVNSGTHNATGTGSNMGVDFWEFF